MGGGLSFAFLAPVSERDFLFIFFITDLFCLASEVGLRGTRNTASHQLPCGGREELCPPRTLTTGLRHWRLQGGRHFPGELSGTRPEMPLAVVQVAKALLVGLQPEELDFPDFLREGSHSDTLQKESHLPGCL